MTEDIASGLSDRFEEIEAKLEEIGEKLEEFGELHERISEIKESVEGVERLIEQRSDRSPSKSATELAPRAGTIPFPVDVATDSEIRQAIRKAIVETNATSQRLSGLVIKTARGRLKDKTFDELQLQITAREILSSL